MGDKIIYGHLFEKLRELGFHESTLMAKGYPNRKFTYPNYPAALMFLPDEPEKPAHHMHVSGVLGMIKVNGIADPALEFFLK